MRVKSIVLLMALALGSGVAAPVGASQEKICRTPKELCDNRCTQIMEIEAAFCSIDLPLSFHPAATRVPAFVTLLSAV